jgi:hypothetical protein
MTILVHPGNVNMLELAGLIFVVLLALWLINALYEWLKQKPWQKKQLPEAVEQKEVQISHDSSEQPSGPIQLSTKII